MEKKWQVLDKPPKKLFKQLSTLPPTIVTLLFHRNIIEQKQIDEFLNPDYFQHVYDPFIFHDMDKTVKRIFKALENNEKIVVHGDYDADGVSASIILVETLKFLGAKDVINNKENKDTNPVVSVFLPHRETDGYGLNTNTIQTFIDSKTNLVITCDCGISNVKEIQMAKDNGIDVIITDHHTVPKQLPPALAIIHPKVNGETYPDKNLAGGGVAFKLTQALLKHYKKKGLSNKNIPIQQDKQTTVGWEKWLLDMVAIASVADMVPLLGETRTLTKYGLIVLNKTRRIGLQKLLLEARILQKNGTVKKEITAGTIGFQIAPRINAAGRMNHANVAYNLLITKDETEAVKLASELNKNNEDRQKLTEKLVNQTLDNMDKKTPILFYLGKNWSTGIIGLIAGKLKEKYNKPTIILAENNGEITGSGRSIKGFNLIESLQNVPEFFSNFGGHPMACGFTLKNKSILKKFRKELISNFKKQTKNLDLQPTLIIEDEIDLDNINFNLYNILKKFEPFGIGNSKPKYIAYNLTVINLKPIGQNKNHLSVTIKHKSEKKYRAVGWNLCNENNNWYKKLKIGDKIDMVFEINKNEWNGNKELQLIIIDLKKL